MTQTVQAFPGGAVRAWRSIATKPAFSAPAEKDGTLIIGRRAAGLPRAAYTIADKDSATIIGTPRDDTLIVGRRLPGLMRAAYTVDDKDEAVSAFKTSSDVYAPFQQLGSLSEVVLRTSDTFRPQYADSGAPAVAVVSTDSYLPRLAQGPSSVLGSGATPVYSSGDTYVPVFALETVHASVLIEGTDTYTPVLTDDSGTGPEKVDLVQGTDTWTPVLRWGWRVIVHTQVNKQAAESYVPRLTLAPASVLKRNAEIDNIDVKYRPIWNFKVRKV